MIYNRRYMFIGGKDGMFGCAPLIRFFTSVGRRASIAAISRIVIDASIGVVTGSCLRAEQIMGLHKLIQWYTDAPLRTTDSDYEFLGWGYSASIRLCQSWAFLSAGILQLSPTH